jgi:hypothetical protein
MTDNHDGTHRNQTMTNDNQTVAYDELEEGKRYYSSTTTDQEVLEVVLIQDDRMIFDTCDDDSNHVHTWPRKKWNPNRYAPVDSIHYDGSSLNEL